MIFIMLRQCILKHGQKKPLEVPANMYGSTKSNMVTVKTTEELSEVSTEQVPVSDLTTMQLKCQIQIDCNAKLKVFLVTLWNVLKFIAILAYFYLCGRY